MTNGLPKKRSSQTALSESPLRVRIGRIQYANVLPFFHHLEPSQGSALQSLRDLKREITLKFFDECPAHINEAMEKSKLDLAPISSLAYLEDQDKYSLLSDLAIGSRDFSGSVLLFSRERIEGLNGEKIAVSAESLSSVMLLKILFKFKYKFDNTFTAVKSNPDTMLSQYKAALVIGDDALFYKPKEFVYKYDLSELWWNWTGKPFCFAVWAVRKPFSRNHAREVEWLGERLRENRDKNLMDIEHLLKDAMGLSFTDERFSKLFGYLFNLIYGLDDPMKEGLELFYRLAHRLGAAPRAKPLEFFSA